MKYKDKIIKVRVSGRIDKADQRHARYESHEINIFNNNALQYWAGVDGVNSHEQEILFEGVLQVIGVYTKYEECYEQELKKEE